MFYTNRALSYLMLRQWTKVVDDCRKALEIDESLVKGHFYLGQAQCELKQFDEAVDSLRMGELIMVCWCTLALSPGSLRFCAFTATEPL